jgi:hypothetical protein
MTIQVLLLLLTKRFMVDLSLAAAFQEHDRGSVWLPARERVQVCPGQHVGAGELCDVGLQVARAFDHAVCFRPKQLHGGDVVPTG